MLGKICLYTRYFYTYIHIYIYIYILQLLYRLLASLEPNIVFRLPAQDHIHMSMFETVNIYTIRLISLATPPAPLNPNPEIVG